MSSMTGAERIDIITANPSDEASSSSVSWAAIIAGVFAASGISLILLTLGAGIGLSYISPWSQPESFASFTVKTAIWLIIVQWVASGVSGYLTGRLRTRWIDVDRGEVFFRDIAHGFLTWAVSLLFTASVIASAMTSLANTGINAAELTRSGMSGMDSGNSQNGAQSMGEISGNSILSYSGYYIDKLFRLEQPDSVGAAQTRAANQGVKGEAAHILLAMGLKEEAISDADKAYLAGLVSAHTGINDTEATQRVDEVLTEINTAKQNAKQDAEIARKTAMRVSMYMFISLIIGAFIASISAAIGGRHRDE